MGRSRKLGLTAALVFALAGTSSADIAPVVLKPSAPAKPVARPRPAPPAPKAPPAPLPDNVLRERKERIAHSRSRKPPATPSTVKLSVEQWSTKYNGGRAFFDVEHASSV